MGGKFVRSQNLAVLLRRDLRRWHREQEKFLVPTRRKATFHLQPKIAAKTEVNLH